ncbi:glycosyltransferase family 4 protein [Patescibacteria group bacterium]|nr:glycosyltransferase family 4 protein [Patescibacteria group bacterium]
MRDTQHRVLMVGWEYPPHNSGGLGVACEGLTHALADTNTNIFFTLPYRFSTAVTHMKVITCQNPAEVELALAGRPPFSAYSPSIVSPADFALKDSIELSALPQSEIEQRVNYYADQVLSAGKQLRQKYDLIHAHDWMAFPAAMKLQEKVKKPFIAHIHSTEMDRIPSGHGSHYIAHTEYLGMQRADRVIAVSNFTKRILIDKYHVDPKKIVVVHNGVTPASKLVNDELQFATKRPMIVFMGRLTAQKGAEYFLQLARAVVDQIPEALFVVAGHGDQYHSLLFQSAYQQLSASVLFTGFMRDHQREALLSRADVFVMPSLSEPFGLVALEAAQRETPVIVSENSGVKEMLTHSLKADFWDVEKMASYITELVTDPVFRAQVVTGQNEDLEHATWQNAADNVSKIYSKLLEKKS